MHAQNFFAAFYVRQIDGDLSIETSGPQQRRIENIGSVRRRNDNHAFLRVEAIHLDEQRIERLFAFIVSAADAVAAMASNRVDFIDENDAGRGFFALLEHVAHARRADSDKHLDEIRTADREKRYVGFARDGARDQRFASARRSDEQNAFRNSSTEFLKLFRIAQKFDQLLHFIFRFLDTGNVAESNFVFITREHARFRFAEIERAFPGHSDLLAEEEIEHEQKKRDWQKPGDGLRDNIGLGPDRGLHSGRRKFLLQVGIVIEVNGGAELDGLR